MAGFNLQGNLAMHTIFFKNIFWVNLEKRAQAYAPPLVGGCHPLFLRWEAGKAIRRGGAAPTTGKKNTQATDNGQCKGWGF